MMQARMVVFSDVKAGNAPEEWEDGAAGRVGDPTAGRKPRFVVVDGATEAYDAVRWVELLVGSFVRSGPPTLHPEPMRLWFEQAQRGWVDGAPATFANVFEKRKFAEGSFATLLGCELSGLDGPAPVWDAVALGDTVLFHVRDGRLVGQFPPLGADGFGLNPEGVHTRPDALPHMMSRLACDRGELIVGDRLFLATDAVAHWIVRTVRRDERALWTTLAALDHPAVFTRLVADQRAAGAMKNDDVTLMRVDLVMDDPDFLVVCL